MIIKSLIFSIFILSTHLLFSQVQIGWLGNILVNDTSWSPKGNYHTSVYPNFTSNNFSNGFSINEKSQIIPLLDVGAQYDGKFNFRTGVGFSIESLKTKRFYFRIGGLFGYQKQDSLFHSPGANVGNSLFCTPLIRLGYKAKKFFDAQIGYDKNFIGDGSRSLFLSDYGKPYPFARLNANFWHVNYSIYYQFLNESVDSKYKSKFAASHHVSWNATRWWNFSIFETVLFQPKDTMLVRGFDAEYLNPLVFYRPQEFSVGSSDNVILGASTSFKWNRNIIYGQFVIDDILVKEAFKRSGWWGNKLAWQIGWKSYLNYKSKLIKVRIESNCVRPYTFSHIHSLANYGNQNSPLAHPLGSNFGEILMEASTVFDKYYLKVFLSSGMFGINKDGKNYGSNIYTPYINRPYDIDCRIGQGIRNYFVVLNLHAAYNLLKEGNIYAFAETQFRYDSAIQGAKFKLIPIIGIRSYLWNDYRNY